MVCVISHHLITLDGVNSSVVQLRNSRCTRRINISPEFNDERKELTMDSSLLTFAAVMLAIFVGGLAVYKKSQ